MNVKTCSLCEAEKLITEFYKDKRGRHGIASRCKKCHASASYESRKKSKRPHARRGYDRMIRLKNHYGLSLEDYDSLLASQNGGCAICGKVPGEDAWERSLAVDHDHACCPGQRSCGKCVRGLLCAGCNTGLGKFYDDSWLLEQAIKYLNKDSCCQGEPQRVSGRNAGFRGNGVKGVLKFDSQVFE